MQISDAEWIVMNVVWEAAPLEAAEVIDRVAAANGWSAATVKTMLHRLVRKGALATDTIGKKYVYRAAVRRDACVRRASQSFLERVCGGHAAPALLHLVKNARLSAEEAAQIRAILDEKLSKREGPQSDK
jgi:BlaI family penicillinase repressor